MMQPDFGPAGPLLALEDVTAGYRRVAAIHDVRFLLAPGETLAIIGANGAGKTTLLRAIMGEIRLIKGVISLDSRPLTGLSVSQRARLGIGYAPEGRELFPAMSVAENLEIGASRVDAVERRNRIERLLDVFPKLRPLVRTHCGYLSGGEQQMVTIARALMGAPRLLVLDEPSTGLAPRVISELYAALGLLTATGLTILVAEQNARAALRFAKRVIVLENGRIVTEGASAELLHDRRLVDAYVGVAGRG
jgi:branched-chain amino acid transport system ATP-binding protein